MSTVESGAKKSKQVNFRLTEAQALMLKRYCNTHGVSTNTAVLTALRAMIPGFEKI